MTRQYRIYVISLSEAARPGIIPPGKDSALPCVYVGYTSKTPEERFAQHKAGGLISTKIVERFGEALLPELYEGLAPTGDENQALRMEAVRAKELRALGYAVYGRHGHALPSGEGGHQHAAASETHNCADRASLPLVALWGARR